MGIVMGMCMHVHCRISVCASALFFRASAFSWAWLLLRSSLLVSSLAAPTMVTQSASSVHARFCAPGLATLHAARSGSSCACGCECACFDCYLLFVVFEIVFSPLLGHTPCCIIRHNLISFCFVAFILLIKKSSTALAVHVACNVSHVACMQPLLWARHRDAMQPPA